MKEEALDLNRKSQYKNTKRYKTSSGLTVLVLLSIFCVVSFSRVSNACDVLVLQSPEFGGCTLQTHTLDHLAPPSMHAFRTSGTVFNDVPPAKASPFTFSIAQASLSGFIEPIQRELPESASLKFTLQGRAPPSFLPGKTSSY
jgi:hypothetical protein